MNYFKLTSKIAGCCLLLFVLNSTVNAQSRRQLLREGEFALYDEDFEAVLAAYEQLEEEFPEERRHLYFKAIAEHMSISRGQDISELLSYEDEYGRQDKYFNYWLGRIYMLRYELDLSRQHFNAFLHVKAYKSKQIIEETKFFLSWIDGVEEYHKNPDDYEISQLPEPINSEYEEISPAFFSDHNELLFASNRPTGTGSNEEEFKIFHSIKTDRGWTTPTHIENFGTSSFENAKIEIIDHDKRIYFFKPENDGDLFFSELVGDDWSEPQEFDSKIRNRHLESHFFINDTEDHILFVSGSTNNKDIWETKLVNGNWSTPRPIKGSINSPFDEESPFLSHSGKTLYFSSNNPKSLGGFDIYKSEYLEDKQAWGKPENMGFPINTMDDDINFEVTPSDQSGFFSSNRLHTKGEYDIFYFHKEDKIEIKGKLLNTKTNTPVANAEIWFHPESYNDEIFKGYTDEFGNYSSKIFNHGKYTVEVKYKGETVKTLQYRGYIPTNSPNLSLNINVYIKTDRPVAQDKTDYYANLYEGSYETQSVEIDKLGSKFREGHTAIIRNIYFDVNSYHIKDESLLVVDHIHDVMNKYPDLQIEVAGHTDNVGDPNSNLKLSLKRAEAVIDRLVAKGIDRSRLVAKGYGETKPLASNDDEINGRELNRRIEINVIE